MTQALLLGCLAVLSACAAAAPQLGVAAREPLRVTGPTRPLGYDEGLAARRLADAACGPRGVRTSDRDRYEAGSWVFVEGCA